VNLGDDADTTGAIYGQLAGAVYVLDGIPERWRRFTAHSDESSPSPTASTNSPSALRRRPRLRRGAPVPSPRHRRRPMMPCRSTSSGCGRGRSPPDRTRGRHTRAEAEAKLTALLTAGITTFIDLTEERDRYRQLAPYSELLKRTAAKVGVRATHLRLPIDDTDVPPAWRMRVILDAIDTAVAAGEVAYIHCWGGVGRTGTVVGCLLREAGVDSETVLDELQALRAHTPRGKRRRSPENARQCDYVTGWVPGRQR